MGRHRRGDRGGPKAAVDDPVLLVLLRHKRQWRLGADDGCWMSEIVFAAWTSQERSDESGYQAVSHGCDRVRYVSLRPQWRILWVDNLGKLKTARTTRRNMLLRGKSSPARRSRIRRPRCTAWHGD